MVRQTTRFPDEGRSHLAFTAERPVRLTLRVRHPFWATAGFGVTVNGVPQPIGSTPGSYVSIVREWTTGDTVDVGLPMSLAARSRCRVRPIRSRSSTGRFCWPANWASRGSMPARRYGPSAPPLSKVAAVEVPALVLSDPARAADVHRAGVQSPLDVPHSRRRPAARRHADPVLPGETRRATPSTGRCTRRRPGTRTRPRPRCRTSAPRVIDSVDLDTPASEQAHGFRGEKTTQPEFEGRIGRETREGWFSYELKVTPDAPGRPGRRCTAAARDGDACSTCWWTA